MNDVLEQWKQRMSDDFRRFGIPDDVIGRQFLFVYGDSSDGYAMRGTVTGVRYGDDGIPFFEVSVRNFTGFLLLALYPTGDGSWTAMNDVQDDHYRYRKGALCFL